jgi:hypothetical protein
MRPLFCFVLAGSLVLAASLAPPAHAAINPAEFTRNVPDQMQLRETARVVHEYEADGAKFRRVTLVGEVLAQKNATDERVGKTVVIDYTVNLSQIESALETWRRTNGNMPGPQFMCEPDPPTPDAEGRYWVNVALAGGRWGNVNRETGAVVDIDGHQTSGPVFVPVSGQYSFDEPYN